MLKTFFQFMSVPACLHEILMVDLSFLVTNNFVKKLCKINWLFVASFSSFIYDFDVSNFCVWWSKSFQGHSYQIWIIKI